ncbi:hypothetical protein KDW39_19845, partial [Burkholderia multivorans]|uniref:hypothetical protein n=1 Tax=Burkholderia multivorans TaxID=87883 RepID=UPI001B981E1C
RCAGRALTPPAALVAVAAAMRDARDTGLTRRRGRYNRRFSRSAGLSWSSGARVGVPAMHRAPAAGPGTARLVPAPGQHDFRSTPRASRRVA